MLTGALFRRILKRVSKPKTPPAKPKEAKTPGTVIAGKLRSRANALSDAERSALLEDALRIVYGGGKIPGPCS